MNEFEEKIIGVLGEFRRKTFKPRGKIAIYNRQDIEQTLSSIRKIFLEIVGEDAVCKQKHKHCQVIIKNFLRAELRKRIRGE